MRDLAFLFPGQGSHYVGMGKSFCDSSPVADRLFVEASDAVGMDLKALCFEGPEATLIQTRNVQPAITLVNLVAAAVLRENGVEPSAAAGHSLGEYSALCAAGVLSFADTMRLVQFRGAAMQEAADQHPGGMLAVFGLGADAASTVCQEVASVGSVEVANHNSPQQVILTGEQPALEAAKAAAKRMGAKLLVALKVSGPWHSRFMAAAKEQMAERLATCELKPPAFPVISNVTGEPHSQDPAAIRASLVAQMVSPVLWMSGVRRLTALGFRSFVEAGPGKVLIGLMKDIDREATGMQVQDAETLAKFLSSRAGAAS